MHIVCWKLLRELHDVLDKSLPGWSEVCTDDMTSPSILLWLFAKSAEQEQILKTSGLDGRLASSNVLAKTAELVASLIAREGDVAMKSMRGTHAVA
jgi:hypothetical protein